MPAPPLTQSGTRTHSSSTRLGDIARRLEVSTSLVSRVLNGKPGAWASEELRQRILDCARDMNYRPHAAARALGSGKAYAVAIPMFVPEGDVGRHGMVIGTLARFLGERGYHLVVDVAESQEKILVLLEKLVQMRSCDAVVLWADECDIEAQARILEPYAIPFIAKGYHANNPQWPQGEFDHANMMTILVNRLADAGHRRIAYMGFGQVRGIWASKLVQGFEEGYLHRFKTPVSPGFLCSSSDSSVWASRLRHWFDLPKDAQPTALIVGTGEEGMWVHVELALARVGRRIGFGPDDFTVTGLRHTHSPLLFGTAEAFPHADLSILTEVMCEKLLMPILNGTVPENPIVRVTPTLRPVPSLNLTPQTPGS